MNLRRLAPAWTVALLGLPACTHYVPLVLPTLKCPIPPGLTQSCARPMTLPDGLSFADLVRDYQADRQSLLLCAVQHDDLRAAIDACNTQIDQYNSALTKLNPGPPAK